MTARLNFAALLALVLSGAFGLWWLAPANAPFSAWLIMFSVLYGPLVIFLPATLQSDRRLLAWLCFLLLFYFCGFVMQAVDPPPVRTLALLRVTLTVVVFALSMLSIRESAQRARTIAE